MKIVLNSTLEQVPHYGATVQEKMPHHVQQVAQALGYNKYRSEKKMTWIASNIDASTEQLHFGYVELLARAYSNHEKVRVAPHDLWFIVLSQIAKIVNENSAACRPLFTTSDEQVDILVPTGDVTKIDPIVLMQYLTRHVPTNGKLFVPELTTANFNVMSAMAAVFADAVQSYYSYSTFCCGIPEIEVTGTVEDWETLTANAMAISRLFLEAGLTKASDYLVGVAGIFEMIERDVRTGAVAGTDFWKDIFRSKNVGSGGELEINGWIVRLFYNPPTLRKIENFMFTLGTFPYRNKETDRTFRTVYGAFEQLRSPEGFIYSGYSNIVYEIAQ